MTGKQLLVSDDGSEQTHYLYGRNRLAEYQATWRYSLFDGAGSVRQLADGSGAVTLARFYKPFGAVLAEGGPDETVFGYLGAHLDPASGLLYANGRYYDPATGRYLTPDHRFDPRRPGTLNPYAPWQGPGFWLLLPVFGLVWVRRRRKDGPWRMLVLVLGMGMGMTLTSCGDSAPPPGLPPTGTFTPQPPQPPVIGQIEPHTATSAPTGAATPLPPTPVPPIPPTPEVCPSDDNIEWLPGLFTITYYSVAVEWDPIFEGSVQVQAPTLNEKFLYEDRTYRDKFLYDEQHGILDRGTGRALKGEYITIEWFHTGGPQGRDTIFVEGKGAEITEWRSVATDRSIIPKGSKIVIESIKNGAAAAVTDSQGVFQVTDTGGGVEGNHIDIYVGEKTKHEIDVISSQTPDVSNTRVGITKP